MVFSFSYVFDSSFIDYRSSPTYEYENIGWFLEVESEKDNICFILYGAPNNRIIRPFLHWEILADVTCKVANDRTFQFKDVLLLNNQTDEHLIGKCLYKATKETLPKESLKVYGGIVFEVHIFNIRVEGLRKFEKIDYSSPFNDSDITISINDKIYYAHTVTLKLRDQIVLFFFPFVTFSIPPSNITLNDEIPVDEFLELLHHLYFPTEIIDDDNLRILLHWAEEFEVTPVLTKCEKIMRETLCNSESQVEVNKIIEYLLLSWKYNIHSLQAFPVYTVFDNECEHFVLNYVMSSLHYQEMDTVRRLKLLELVLESLLYHHHANKKVSKKNEPPARIVNAKNDASFGFGGFNNHAPFGFGGFNNYAPFGGFRNYSDGY
ncbi:unnamed protein product [Auanema sp. JU1783]|nr:unnamed protein product [Auanema sp. JU1783]